MKKNTADSISFVRMVGANLKFLRLNRKIFMPQKVVAHALDITHQQVNKYETGKNTPCAYRLKQLADFFGVTCNDLVDPSYIVKNTKNHNKTRKRTENFAWGSIPGFDYSCSTCSAGCGGIGKGRGCREDQQYL